MKVNQVNYPWFLHFSAYHFQYQPPFSSSPLWRVDRLDHSARSCCFPPGFRRHLRLIKDTPAVSASWNGWMTKWKMAIVNIWIAGDSILELYWIFMFFYTWSYMICIEVRGSPAWHCQSVYVHSWQIVCFKMVCLVAVRCCDVFPCSPHYWIQRLKKSHQSNICTVYI